MSPFPQRSSWMASVVARYSEESALRLSLTTTDMVKQYRKLDDQIIVRLNRAAAQLRDQDRLSRPGQSSSSSSLNGQPVLGPEGMCTAMWMEMMGKWRFGPLGSGGRRIDGSQLGGRIDRPCCRTVSTRSTLRWRRSGHKRRDSTSVYMPHRPLHQRHGGREGGKRKKCWCVLRFHRLARY